METTYLDTLQAMRGRIHGLNTKLPAFRAKSVVVADGTADVAHQDRALFRKSQQTESTFTASINEFSLHWETMTTDQRRHHLDEYVQSQYGTRADLTPSQVEAVRTFLHQEILASKRGPARVTWNGYFVERLPEVEWTGTSESEAGDGDGDGNGDGAVDPEADAEEEEETKESEPTPFVVRFKACVTTGAGRTKRKVVPDASFQTLRAQVQREKRSLYVTEPDPTEDRGWGRS